MTESGGKPKRMRRESAMTAAAASASAPAMAASPSPSVASSRSGSGTGGTSGTSGTGGSGRKRRVRKTVQQRRQDLEQQIDRLAEEARGAQLRLEAVRTGMARAKAAVCGKVLSIMASDGCSLEAAVDTYLANPKRA
jgi:hypothetical protein